VDDLKEAAERLIERLHRSEQALNQSEQALSAFRSYVETSPMASWVVDDAGKYFAVSAAYAELAGQPAKDLIGQTPVALFGEAEDNIFASHMEQLRDSGQWVSVQVVGPARWRVMRWLFTCQEGRSFIGAHAWPETNAPVR
jgi:PAS domain S-box-containing protein